MLSQHWTSSRRRRSMDAHYGGKDEWMWLEFPSRGIVTWSDHNRLIFVFPHLIIPIFGDADRRPSPIRENAITLSLTPKTRFFEICNDFLNAKPEVSLTAPNRDHFAQVSLMVLDFLDAIAKAKKLICKSIAQNLEQDLLTRRLFSFGNGG